MYFERQRNFNAQQAEDEGGGGAGRKQAGAKKGNPAAAKVAEGKQKDVYGEVSLQLKIEFMLRFYFKLFLKSTFPFIPQPMLQDLMVKRAKMRFNDMSAMTKLYEHLTKCAQKNIMTLPAEKRAILQKYKKDPHDQYINLKELRDQMLGYRCSNGKLFMYGMANEGRLGVTEKKFDFDAKDKGGDKNLDMKLLN